mmetsp:Transcript_9492/g.19852  ORF Transcript_9492/g.19852 Transcript_9492/m.19852 type:complete len:100 (-) Transcript_9492:48-347(-)
MSSENMSSKQDAEELVSSDPTSPPSIAASFLAIVIMMFVVLSFARNELWGLRNVSSSVSGLHNAMNGVDEEELKPGKSGKPLIGYVCHNPKPLQKLKGC